MRKCLLILSVLVFLTGCKGYAFRVPTVNMVPTINVGDICIVDQYSSISIQRFDIVMFKAPEWAKKLSEESGDVKYVSRVIGFPGEKIEIKDNKIFINDNLLDESFEKITDAKDKGKDFPAMLIPQDEYFLLGDNRPQSLDSRYWKPATIKKGDILGEVIDCNPADAKN